MYSSKWPGYDFEEDSEREWLPSSRLKNQKTRSPVLQSSIDSSTQSTLDPSSSVLFVGFDSSASEDAVAQGSHISAHLGIESKRFDDDNHTAPNKDEFEEVNISFIPGSECSIHSGQELSTPTRSSSSKRFNKFSNFITSFKQKFSKDKKVNPISSSKAKSRLVSSEMLSVCEEERLMKKIPEESDSRSSRGYRKMKSAIGNTSRSHSMENHVRPTQIFVAPSEETASWTETHYPHGDPRKSLYTLKEFLDLPECDC